MNMLRNLLAVGALALFSTAGQAATVVLQNHSSNISIGDEFLIDVILQNPFEGDFQSDILLTFGFDLSYDNTAFALTSKSVGGLWDDDTPFLDVDLAGSVFPGIVDDGSNTPILLGQLSFTALSAGAFTLGVAGDPVANPNLGLLYLGGDSSLFAETLVNVTPSAPVPVPAAGWLLASGLLGLSRLRRART